MKKLIGILLLMSSLSFSANATKIMTPLQKEKADAVFLYEKENSNDADLIKAIVTFEKYADKDPKMRYYFGLANIEGKTKTLRLSPVKGLELIREASLLGDKHAQYYFAMAQIKKDDLQSGIANLKKSAASGFPLSQYQLGKMYYQGNGVARNRQAGFQLIKLAADKEIADAQYDLAKIYFSQEDINLKKGAIFWLSKSVKNGKVAACEDLYKLYKEGLVVTADIKKHLHYLKCSAQNNSIDAIKLYASYLETGKYLPKNMNQSMYWYKKASDLGDAESTFIYARNSLSKTPNQSIVILKSIADNYEPASFLLGKIYKYGLYKTKPSRHSAIRYFEISKSKGNKEAINEIISMTD